MGKRIKRCLVIWLGICMMLNFVSSINAYAEDTQKLMIDIDSLSISATQVTVGDIVTISVNVIDTFEVDNVSLNLANTETNYPLENLPMSYNTITGLYEYTLKVTDDMPNGIWKVSDIMATDKAGNGRKETFDEKNKYFKVTGTNGDSQPPIIDASSLMVSTTSATIGDIVTISVRVTDDTGIDHVYIELANESSNYYSSLLMNYNEITGLYEYKVEVTDETREGFWKIISISATDKMWNIASETNFNSGYFEINGTNIDSRAPVIDADTVKYSMQQATVGDIVTVSLKITDDGEIDYASIELKNMDTNYILLERCLMTYNELSGLYEYQFKITDEIPNGRWKISEATVYDKASNYSRETNFGDNYIEVTGTNADSEAPVIDASSLRFSKAQATVGDMVTVSVKITDNVGVKGVSLNLKNAEKNQYKTYLQMTYNDRTELYEYQFEVTPDMKSGYWTVESVYADDKQFNSNTVRDFQAMLLVVDENIVNNVYSIRYCANGTSVEDVVKEYSLPDGGIVIEKNLFEKTGYYFTGWNTEQDGSGESYYPGDTIMPSDRETILYAQWDVKLENVTMRELVNTENGVQINWSALENAVTYRVYRKTENGKWEILTRKATGTLFVDHTAENGKLYYYTVRAENENSISPSFDGTKKITCIRELEDVVMVSVCNSSNGVKVNWKPVTGAKAYRVYRRMNGGKWTLLAGNAGGVSFLDRTAQEGVTYYYTVRALNDKVISPSCDQKHNIVCIKQLTDVSIGSLQNTNQGVMINWSAVSGAKSYRIYRRNVNGNWTVLTSRTTETNYLDRTAQEGTTYYYTVRALNGEVISQSCEKRHNIGCVKQLPNVTIGTMQNSSQGVIVNWSTVSGAKSYRVYRRTIDGSWTVLTNGATGTSYLDKTAQNGITYYYTVRALNDRVISPSCNQKKNILSVNKLENVVLSSLNNTSSGVKVEWSTVGNAKSYRVYRRTESGKWTILADKFTGTDYIDKTAQSGITYYYTVRALNDKVISPSYDGKQRITYSASSET